MGELAREGGRSMVFFICTTRTTPCRKGFYRTSPKKFIPFLFIAEEGGRSVCEGFSRVLL
jgi:hypothetical protein